MGLGRVLSCEMAGYRALLIFLLRLGSNLCEADVGHVVSVHCPSFAVLQKDKHESSKSVACSKSCCARDSPSVYHRKRLIPLRSLTVMDS